jgi:hypothetical protein
METYDFDIKMRVSLPAHSSGDAKSALEDVFGPGEIEGLDILVSDFTVNEV